MGLLRKLLIKNYSMSDFDRDVRTWMGGQVTTAGPKVNERTALRYITLYACVRVRAESFGSLPLGVYKRRSGGGRDEAHDHPLHDKIHAAPNDEMTSLTWRETMSSHLDLGGNCASIITQNRRGQVIDLYPWPWDQVDVKRNEQTRKLEYHINDRGKVEVYPPEKVFHVPGLGHDGVKGYSIIGLMREYVGLGLSISEFIERFFGQGMNVGSLLQTDKSLNQEQVDDLRQQFLEKGAGLANSWMPLVMHSGLKFARIPMSLVDAQTVEILKLTDSQICGLYRVPPHMVAQLDRATFSNIEHQGIEYVIYSMLPLITRFEQTMNWRLFTPAERAAGYYVKFNVDALLRGDAKTRAEALAIKRQNGVINGDEWRALDDQNPIGGVAGQAFLVNGNMISTETAAQQQLRNATGNGGDE